MLAVISLIFYGNILAGYVTSRVAQYSYRIFLQKKPMCERRGYIHEAFLGVPVFYILINNSTFEFLLTISVFSCSVW